MNVVFVNENTLGHVSHVPRFFDELKSRPELGITPHLINAMPLPGRLKSAERGVRGLNRFGLDWQLTRWRRAASRHVADQVIALRRRVALEAVVVNTQSVGLYLPEVAPDLPCWVALDATFAELRDSPWFAPKPWARWFHPLTLRWLMSRERRLFRHARGLLPWSEHAEISLRKNHPAVTCPIHRLPPSLHDPGTRSDDNKGMRPRLLFIGGDFRRKGGPELLAAWESGLRALCDLDIATRDEIPARAGMKIHRGVEQGGVQWTRLWQAADLFVFPSHLETFGIVLLEAMAFGVPVVASRAGAAREILDEGRIGWLLPEVSVDSIARAVAHALGDCAERRRRAALGCRHFLEKYELSANTTRLAGWLRGGALA